MQIEVYGSGSKGNAYKISDGKTQILIDCGLPFREIQKKCGFKMSQIDACLVSHDHLDHSKAVKDLLHAGTDVYTSQGTIAIRNFKGHRLHPIKALEEFRVGTFKILPFDVEHDAPEPLGFLLTSTETKEKLLYFTDTFYLKYTFKGLTHIMCEANYSEEGIRKSMEAGYIPVELAARLFKSHMSIENLVETLKVNDLTNVKQIYLLHMSDNNGEELRFKREVQQISGVEVYVC